MRLDLSGGEERRAPQPIKRYGLAEEVLPQLLALKIDPDRPILAVDADEVLLHFARHLQRFMAGEGYRLDLSEYRLDGAISRLSDGAILSKSEGWALISLFFARETRTQEIVEGAAETLAALAEDPSLRAQVLILTNVPQSARAARVANLAGHGLGFPLVANVGGKGRALRYLWDHSAAPVAFVDDSALQLGSAATRAPGVARVHFVADPDLRRVAGRVEHAEHAMESWPAGERLLRRLLTG
ncbi:MAG: hypothetical protein AAFW46_10920 [Pseudomonadota bacterium]